MNPDTKQPVVTTRFNWYARLFLFASVPMTEAIYREMVVNSKPFSWLIVLGAWPQTVAAILAFMSRSVPEDTKGQIEKRRETTEPPPDPERTEDPQP